MELAAEFVAGGIGGGLGIIVSQPLDTIRIRLQTKTAGQKMDGIMQCAMTTVRHEGIRGLFKGVGAPVLTVGFMNAILFTSYEGTMNMLRSPEDDSPRTRQQVVISAVAAGAVSACINSPTELIKVHAQTCTKSVGTLADEVRIFRQIIRTGGLGAMGLSRGLGITLGRDTFSYAFYFGLYELIIDKYGRDGYAPFIGGGLCGMAAWACCYPVDVLKTHWQTNSTYTSIAQCFRSGIGAEGYSFMFKGLGATLLRAAPQHAVTFYCYEWVRSVWSS